MLRHQNSAPRGAELTHRDSNWPQVGRVGLRLAANPTYPTYMLFSPLALMQQALAAIKSIFFVLDSRRRWNDWVAGIAFAGCLCAVTWSKA